MKYLKTLLFLIVLLLFSIKTPFVSAQETQIMPIRPPDTTPILGQEHAYSVLFRGNGDAIVTMKAAFINEGEAPTNIVSFRIPRVEPRRVNAFQIISDQETNYYQWYGQTKYQKAKTEFNGDTLTVSLPQSIKPGKSGSVLIVFSATGYARKNLFGAYNYTFETFKVKDTSVTKATIGISVDSDLILAGAKGTVNYRFSDTEAMSLAAGVEKGAAPNTQLDQMYSQVGYGTITKTASHLEPLESYAVKGRYADSLIRLYGKDILIGLGIFVIAVVLLFFLGRAAIHAHAKQQPQGIAPSSADIVLTIGGSFLSAALIAVYTAGLFLLRNTIAQIVSYEMVGIVFILVTIISIGIYGFLLIAPTLLVGLRRGLAWGLGTFGLTIFFLVINAVIMVVILMLLYGNGNQPPIYNIMKGITPEATRMDSAVKSQE
ncbi:MAG: hypothetical protein AAB481_04595 [Patescibacteria group bacterium]